MEAKQNKNLQFNLHTTSGVVLDPKEWHHLLELYKPLWRHKKPLVVWRLKDAQTRISDAKFGLRDYFFFIPLISLISLMS